MRKCFHIVPETLFHNRNPLSLDIVILDADKGGVSKSSTGGIFRVHRLQSVQIYYGILILFIFLFIFLLLLFITFDLVYFYHLSTHLSLPVGPTSFGSLTVPGVL